MHNNTGAILKSYKTLRKKEQGLLSLPGKISVHWDTGNQWICPQTAAMGADGFTETVFFFFFFGLKCSLRRGKKDKVCFVFFFSCQKSCGCLPLQQSLTVHLAVLGNNHIYIFFTVRSESFQTISFVIMSQSDFKICTNFFTIVSVWLHVQFTIYFN